MKLSELKLLVYKVLSVSITKQVKEIYPHLDLRSKKSWEIIYYQSKENSLKESKELNVAAKGGSWKSGKFTPASGGSSGVAQGAEGTTSATPGSAAGSFEKTNQTRNLSASQLATEVFAANQDREFLIGPSGQEGRFNLFEDGYSGIQLRNATDMDIIAYARSNRTTGRVETRARPPERRMSPSQLNDAILATGTSRNLLTGPSGAPGHFSLFESGRSSPHLLDATPNQVLNFVRQNLR